MDEVLGPSLTEEQAREIYRQGEEAVVMAMMKMAAKIAALSRPVAPPTTPSAMIPPYQKPPAAKSRKKPGAKDGHKGHRRPPPQRIDQRREHRLARCPHCQGPGRCFMCDFEAGVCDHCRGTGVDIGTPEGVSDA